MYTAGRTAELTGIPRETLRKWEQRYGVVQPARSEGNYRLYDDEAVRRLSVMRDLVDAGWSPREAAKRVCEVSVGGVSVPTSDVASTFGHPHDLTVCASEFDLERLEQALDKAFAQQELGSVVDDWLMPALAHLGEAWQRGEVTIAGEHFVSAAVLRRLAQTFAHLPHAAPDAPSVMVGLARGSRHELGVMAFAVVLRASGVKVTYLGADLPVEAWVDTARAVRPDAVVLGVPTIEDLPAVREAVGAIAKIAPVLLGGAHQRRVEHAEPLGHAAGRAATELARRLTTA